MTPEGLIWKNPWWVWVGIGAAIYVLITFGIWAWKNRDRRVWALVFGALRLAALGILIFLFAGPVRVHTSYRKIAPRLLIYVDDSQSMSRLERDPKAMERKISRFDSVITALKNSGLLNKNDASKTTLGIRLFRFADSVRDFSSGPAPDGPATSISAPLINALGQIGPGPMDVLIISDGIHNQGPDPVHAAETLEERGVRVHAMLAGSDTPVRNLGLRDLAAPGIITRGKETNISVVVAKRGYGEIQAALDVLFENSIVGGKTVKLAADRNSTEITIPFLMPESGVGRLWVRLRAPDDEELAMDNALWKRVQVVKDKFKVLFVEGEPGWDSVFLARVLNNMDFLDITYFLGAGTKGGSIQLGKGRRQIDRFPAGTLDFDVIILGDTKAAGLGKNDFNAIAGFLKRGRALITLGGADGVAAGTANGTELRDLMALQFSSKGPMRRGFELRLTDDGETSPVCRLSDDKEETKVLWETLPILYTVFPNQENRGQGVKVLLRESRENIPILAVRQQGCMKVLNFAAPGLWRWQMASAAITFHKDIYKKFWETVLKWAVTCERLGAVTLSLDQDHPRLGDEIIITAQIINESFEPETADEARALIKDAGGNVLELIPLLASDTRGEYKGIERMSNQGDLTITVEAFRNGKSIGTDSRPVNVWSPALESENLAASDVILRAIAEKTTGLFGGLESLDKVIQAASAREATVAEIRKEPLDANYWLFGLAFLLLGIEWFLRRRYGLG